MLVWVVWDLDVMDGTPYIENLISRSAEDISRRFDFKDLHIHIEQVRLFPRLDHGA
jgi:uncharacterized protein YajQ (UPF0234 family)